MQAEQQVMVVDPNMDTALEWANELYPSPQLPSSLQDVGPRARLVDSIDTHLINNSLLHTLGNKEKRQRIETVAELARKSIPDVDDKDKRASIALRLWSGCLSAAKTIALETRSGPNTSQTRKQLFLKIDAIAQRDPVYRAGVEAAPEFKGLRGNPISFDGVPKNSPVRRYKNTPQN